MALLPPMPTGVPPGSAYWNQWYEELRSLVNSGTISTTWSNINFTGSNITSIVTRPHNSLQSIQGGSAGDYQHLTSAQVGTLGLLTMTSQSADPSTSDITAGTAKLYKNTTSGTVKLWVNDGGTMKSVTLS